MTTFAGTSERRLYRDADRAILGGVCAGLARYLGFNLKVTRFLAVIAFLCAMPFAIVGYLAAVFLIPSSSSRIYDAAVIGIPDEKYGNDLTFLMHPPHIFICIALFGLTILTCRIQFYITHLISAFQNFFVILMLDEQIHDLIGAGPDLAQADVSDHFFYGIDVGVTDATHNLHGLVGDFPGGIGGIAFGFTNDSANIGCTRVH